MKSRVETKRNELAETFKDLIDKREKSLHGLVSHEGVVNIILEESGFNMDYFAGYADGIYDTENIAQKEKNKNEK